MMLSPIAAYAEVMQFAARCGEDALCLALHAAVPQSFRAELLHLLRLNFVPDAQVGHVVEADVLLASFCEALGGGYYQFEPAVRALLLSDLMRQYAGEVPQRVQQVADFLLHYVERSEQESRSTRDRLWLNYLEIQRWVAHAFREPEQAAEQLAQEIAQALDGSAAARVQIGGLASALMLPLRLHHDLLTYAAGVQAFFGGDQAQAAALFDALGPRPITVGATTLRAPQALLDAVRGTQQANVAQQSQQQASASMGQQQVSDAMFRQQTIGVPDVGPSIVLPLQAPVLPENYRVPAEAYAETIAALLAAPRIDRDALRRIIVETFDYNEVRDLCFDLHIDYESVPGRNKSAKVRDLIIYLERRGRIDELVTYIQRKRPQIVISEGVAITNVAITGASGVGKTLLAAAVCHDPQILVRFSDGVLWVNAASADERDRFIWEWLAALGGSPPLERMAALTQLREQLKSRACLLVLDDLRQDDDLQRFLTLGGPRCATLIVTRDADRIASRISGRVIDLDGLEVDEATALLVYGLPSISAASLENLVRRANRAPAVLALLNAELRRQAAAGVALEPLLRTLNERFATTFSAGDMIGVAITFVLQQMPSAQRDRLDELAIFPADVPIPQTTLETLWRSTGRMEASASEDLLRLLAAAALLEDDQRQARIRISPLLRAYLDRLPDRQRAAWHRALLDAHRPFVATPKGSEDVGVWADMPDDEPYLWNHLFYHLIGAELTSELSATANDLRYLAKKGALHGVAALLADLVVAAQHLPDEQRIAQLRDRALALGTQIEGASEQTIAKLLDEQPQPTPQPPLDKRELRKRLLKHFDGERLEILCEDISTRLEAAGHPVKVTPAIVGGKGLEAIVKNLIAYLEQRELLPFLLDAVREAQPGLL